PAIVIPSLSNTARTLTTTPLAVAPAWARVPPNDRGLPVTEEGSACPRIIDSVSMSHAITRPSVLTSGAGTSRSGPSSGEISYVYPRVRPVGWRPRNLDAHRTPYA